MSGFHLPAPVKFALWLIDTPARISENRRKKKFKKMLKQFDGVLFSGAGQTFLMSPDNDKAIEIFSQSIMDALELDMLFQVLGTSEDPLSDNREWHTPKCIDFSKPFSYYRLINQGQENPL